MIPVVKALVEIGVATLLVTTLFLASCSDPQRPSTPAEAAVTFLIEIVGALH